MEAGHVTLEVAFRKMVWSFNALYEGRWPKFDWDNNPMSYEKAFPQGAPHITFKMS